MHQTYLLKGSQLLALWFAAHIPLVCFGIAFLAMVLSVKWMYLGRGNELLRVLARRWSIFPSRTWVAVARVLMRGTL